LSFSLYSSAARPHLHPFPTRRSSDLEAVAGDLVHHAGAPVLLGQPVAVRHEGAASSHIELGFPRMKRDAQVVDEKVAAPAVVVADRKSTRLNSTHVSISYAVFCLKKK